MREKFKEQISQIKQEDLVYVDESGFDVNMRREYGYSLKGTRIIDQKSGKKSKLLMNK